MQIKYNEAEITIDTWSILWPSSQGGLSTVAKKEPWFLARDQLSICPGLCHPLAKSPSRGDLFLRSSLVSSVKCHLSSDSRFLTRWLYQIGQWHLPVTNDQQIWLSLCYVGNGHIGILLFIVALKRERRNGPGNLAQRPGKNVLWESVFLFSCLFVFAPSWTVALGGWG